MIVDVVLFQDSAPIVVEVYANLLPAVDPVTPENGLTPCCDPHTRQGIGMDLVTLYDATPIVVLWGKAKRGQVSLQCFGQ